MFEYDGFGARGNASGSLAVIPEMSEAEVLSLLMVDLFELDPSEMSLAESLDLQLFLALFRDDIDGLDVTPETVSLFMGNPRVGHCSTDLLAAVAGGAGWRRVSGRDVVFGLDGDPSALDWIPPARMVPLA